MVELAETATAVALDPMVPVRYRVAARTAETADTVTLDLAPVDEPIAVPSPGQFTMLYAFGAGEAPISVSGLPGDGRLRHTVRAAGPTTRTLAGLEPGAMVGVRGPYGQGWPIDEVAAGADLVVVAGGLGLAPLRPLVRAVLDDRDRYGRVTVVIGTRTPDDLLFADELATWRGRLDVDVEVTVDAAPPAWRGEVGVVTRLLPRAAFRPEETTAFVCGPEPMQRVVARTLTLAGVVADRIHVSLERNMQCAVRHCGHCLLGPMFVCHDGPVVPWSVAAPLLEVRRW